MAHQIVVFSLYHITVMTGRGYVTRLRVRLSKLHKFNSPSAEKTVITLFPFNKTYVLLYHDFPKVKRKTCKEINRTGYPVMQRVISGPLPESGC